MAKASSDAILMELESAVRAYVGRKRDFESIRTSFIAARDKYNVVRKLASEILSPDEWFRWSQEHPHVQYAGVPIREAILEVLEGAAYSSALDHTAKGTAFKPEMSVTQIVAELEEGGFEFNSATPGREVNATLINTKGVTKVRGCFQVENTDEILASAAHILSDVPKK